MTIKDIEDKVGITKANIRFYEKEGLLSPGRGSNNYREYMPEEAETLEKIKLLKNGGRYVMKHDKADQFKKYETWCKNLVSGIAYTVVKNIAAGDFHSL